MRSVERTVTVLIVDDQSAVRDVLRRILDKAGRYAVAEAANVSEALTVLAEAPPDAVLLDISMPGGPGLTVISALRRRGADTKILVLSSHSEMEREVLAMGAHAFLPKTTPSHDVLATLGELTRV